jgi:hypothetical protein
MTKLLRDFARTVLAALALVHVADAETVVNSTFLGGDSLYSNPANWSPGEVPNNTATKKYNVTAMPRFFLDNGDVTVSNLTIGGWLLASLGPSLTVTGATTINLSPGGTSIPGIFLSATTGPITFSLGSLSTFANGVLTGAYSLFGPATLQFNGADVTALSGTSITLEREGGIVNENGLDGLRNLARIDSDSSLTMTAHQFATAGDLTMDGMLTVGAYGNVPGSFRVTGSLTNFDGATRTLRSGKYQLNGGSTSATTTTFEFSGADIVNNGATLSFFGSAAIVDELGRDGFRNFSRNLATGRLSLLSRDLTISGDFTNDGLLETDSKFAIQGTLTNYDAASKTLNGGTYRITAFPSGPGRLSFTGADIVHNNAVLAIGSSTQSGLSIGKVTDENGNDAIRNLVENQAGAVLELGNPFNATSDFSNAGVVVLGYTSFTVPAGHVYQQTAGSTALNATKFTGAMNLAGGELTSTSIPPSTRSFPAFPGATPTITGNVAVGTAVLKPAMLGVTGNVQLSNGSTWRYVAGSPDVVKAGLNVSGTLTLAGKLEVEFSSPFPPASAAKFYIATAGQLGGAFTNAAAGTRITTTDGAGSFVLSFTSQNQILLTDYQRTAPTAQLLNISTRAHVLTADNVEIGGFIIDGNDSKKVVIRALGPSLTGAGVGGALQDPTLELHDATGAIISANDNWGESQRSEITATGLAPHDARESAILTTLPPGAYTAVMRGTSDATGVALLEVYDLSKDSQSKLANISTRGFVDPDNVLIGGLIAGGNASGNAELVLRAIGSGLQGTGVKDYLADPALELRDENGDVIAANDDFITPRENLATVPAQLRTHGDGDAATGVKVPPGNYTVVVYGKNGASGNAVVEIYDLNH